MYCIIGLFKCSFFAIQIKFKSQINRKDASLCCNMKDQPQSSMSVQLVATRVHSGPADGLQPFPSPHLPTYRSVRQLPQSAFDRIICFSSAVHVFVLCQLQKTHFSFFSPSCFPCLLLASLCGVRGERECGFNQRAGQPPPLMIHSTSRLTEERGRGGWVKQSAW